MLAFVSLFVVCWKFAKEVIFGDTILLVVFKSVDKSAYVCQNLLGLYLRRSKLHAAHLYVNMAYVLPAGPPLQPRVSTRTRMPTCSREHAPAFRVDLDSDQTHKASQVKGKTRPLPCI